ncbi:MAG: PEP/pyruvate-binding domain-containing protein [bacterium]|nr:PEP/pyruvate-binding domain-containing protein [bacterium]
MSEKLASESYLKDTAFWNLMQRRIFNVLLVATPYDAFMLEEDGRLEEQIYFEYTSLNLSSPPRFTQVSDYEEAFEELSQKRYDLVIAMPGVDISETFVSARKVKELYPDVAYVVLTPFSREVSRRLAKEDFTGVDFVFSWLGNVDLLVAIIKLLEDYLNVENDVNQVGVQLIMLVEDSVRFYSSILPTLYKFLLQQSRDFSTEALNEHEQMLRMRGRPKVMLARNYEEAMQIYEHYGDHMLGVISDVSFAREGKKDSQAGLRLANELRRRNRNLPIIIESSEVSNASKVAEFGGTFLDKNSKKLPVDLGQAILDNFGFGDFIIRNPKTGEVISRIKDLRGLQNSIFDIPTESLYYHANHDDISRWLYSRALFPIAEVLTEHTFDDITEEQTVRQTVFDAIVKYRRMKNRGVVAIFKRDRFDHYSNFARIGQGSLGGKGRGLAFIDSIIKKNPEFDNFEGVSVQIPRTVVLCTDIFDQFMKENKLYPIALSSCSDEEILQHFLAATLPRRLAYDFYALFDVIDGPLAIRSSSLLEDSHYQPFAGIYSTYMIPHLTDKRAMLKQLSDAIKGVYASVFFTDSKAYMQATSNVIDQEKMAVIIQEVVGSTHDGYFYPSFSGVGRSLNYYPVNEERAEDGVCEIAVGLGKYIVDGGMALRFSPKHPRNVLQTSTLDLALRDTQTTFYAINESEAVENFKVDDGFNITRLRVQDAAMQGHLKYMVSTYNPFDEMIVDNDMGRGRKVVTFANILSHEVFPLAKIADSMLHKGQLAMNRPVEIEFAGMIGSPEQMKKGEKGHLYWLQIRPIVDRKEMLDEEIMHTEPDKVLLYSTRALGHGMMDNITAVVFVKPEAFSMSNNLLIASEIEKINRNFTEKEENYILIGIGRWGSSDSALGIPVKWPHISAAKLIVELSVPGSYIEPSQGTHFFQNLTSFGVGYFTLDTGDKDTIFAGDYLAEMPAEYESDNVRIVRFAQPLTVAINGRSGQGIVLKPEHNE